MKKLIDPRKQRVILAMDVNQRGYVEIVKDLLINSSNLIAALVDRQNTPGLAGHGKNYAVCKAIAELKIAIDQGTILWSADNIATFERSHVKGMEQRVRDRRKKQLKK